MKQCLDIDEFMDVIDLEEANLTKMKEEKALNDKLKEWKKQLDENKYIALFYLGFITKKEWFSPELEYLYHISDKVLQTLSRQPDLERYERLLELQINNSLKIKEFKEMTEEWLDFIVDSRHGVEHNYDIVIGAMAKFKYPTYQINFCTEAALRCLKYRDCQEVLK
ncbi:MAG: hypothetical protein K0R34_3186 [Herbinix sp.]|jgi:hypothetical protein|nr:hypothetical protein [Herbinix sp.]